MGHWMKVNGESIYGTTASPFTTQLAWGRATPKPGTVYLHVFDWPPSGTLTVPDFGRKVLRARLLAAPATAVTVTGGADGTTLALPATAPDPVASVIALEIAR